MSNLSSMFGTSNVAIPDEGPKCIRAELDFGSESEIDIEGLLATTTGTMSYVQGVFIDNFDNDNELSLSCSVTQQRIICPANSQGFFPLLITNPPRFVAETTPVANLRVRMFFYNVPIQPMVWNASGALVTTGLTNAELRATPVPVSGPATNAQLVAALLTTIIGVAYTNRSIANLSGASEALMAANANRRILIVSNEGATAVAVNLTGGAAALNTAGNVTLLAGGSITLDTACPVGAITVIGTLNADVTAYEG